MGSRILWAVVAGFLLGVFARSFLPLGWSTVGFIVLLGGAALALGALERAKLAHLVVVAVALFSCAAGVARMHTAVLIGDPRLNARIGSPIVLEGVIADEPDAREKNTLITVDARALVASTTLPVQAKVLATLPAHALVRYGDKVKLSGTLELPAPFDTGLGRQFDYPQYLAAQGIGYQLAFARVDTEGNAGDPLKAAIFGVKEKFVGGLRAVLPEPEAGLAGGITVGDKRSIGPELSAAFQRDSLIHMVVLSGYNITVVLNAVARLLVAMPRLVQFGGSIGIVVFFILMAGGASSAERAGLMALIAVLARATHRIYLGERALGVVALLMVAWNPFVLAFDPSFQLSSLATLGLILFTPIFARLFERVPERFGAREILASTCATQLMVLPLLLYENGTLSLVALPANLLALAPVPFAMLFSFVAALGGMLFGTFAAPLALPAYALLWYIITIAQTLASLPFAALTLPAFSAWWLMFLYGILALVLLLERKQQPRIDKNHKYM
jgi:competence protein ComEC